MNKITVISFLGIMLVASSIANASTRQEMEIRKQQGAGLAGVDISGYISNNESAGKATDFVCDNSFMDKVNNRIKKLIPNVCAQLDTSNSLEGNPFAYENPNAFCDVGQSMVGQPDWTGGKFDVNGANACEVAKMVVGDHVRGAIDKYNEYNDLVNGALSASGGVDAGGALESILGK